MDDRYFREHGLTIEQQESAEGNRHLMETLGFKLEMDLPEPNYTHADCNSNCQLAKEAKCVCGCRGRNHGAALKKLVKPLDQFMEED